MYKISVPVMPAACRVDWNLCIEQLRAVGAERAFVINYQMIGNPVAHQKEMALVAEAVEVLKNAGFEVGVWLGETLGHGARYSDWAICDWVYKPTQYVDAMGKPVPGVFCPLDKGYLEHIDRWLRDVAALHPSLIMLDDDFRMGMKGDEQTAAGCLCDLHVADFCRRVGKQMTRDEIRHAVFTGLNPEYRKAWLDMQGEGLLNMARVVREAVDAVDPTIRVGQCTCTTLLDSVDGVTPMELARVFSPRTKPFLRMAGSCSMAGREVGKLSDCIEEERRNAQYAREINPDIELMAEGDPFPRPRFTNPAVFLELQDMALRADGHFDGMLKYMGEYCSSPSYEPGYFDRHVRNAKRYQAIERMFAGKRATGVRVLECRDLIRETVFPDGDGYVSNWESMYNNPSAGMKFLATTSIPTTYDAEGVGVTLAFDQNALHTTHEMRKNGVILNMHGALLLKEQGVDVGIVSATRSEVPAYEWFPDEPEVVNLWWRGEPAYDTVLDERATVLSKLTLCGKTRPGAFIYTNEDGESFLIFPFDKMQGPMSESYSRQRQMVKAIAMLGHPLAASCAGHPSLFMMVKENDDEVTIGLFNLSADEMINPTVTLTFDGTVKETLDCRVRQEGRLIHIEGDILSNRVAVITVAKAK